MKYLQRIENLRDEIKSYGLDGYIISNQDEFQLVHKSEFDNRLLWLTGFSGSHGHLLVTHKNLYFFTDARYLLQGEIELNEKANLRCIIIDVFDKRLSQERNLRIDELSSIGYNAKLYSKRMIRFLQNAFDVDYDKFKIIYYDIPSEMVKTGILSNNQNDEVVNKKIFLINAFNKKMSYVEKLSTIVSIIKKSQKELQKSNIVDTNYVLLTSPISICWLLNIRGSDVKETPVILSYAILELKQKKLMLFAKFPHNLKQDIADKLGEFIIIKPFNDVYKTFNKILDRGESVYLDFEESPMYFISDKRYSDKISNLKDPTVHLRACKNLDEIEYIKRAHIEDGIAWCKFLSWIELSIQKKQNDIVLNEILFAQKLLQFKMESENFLSLSFETISAFKEHGAIIHYNPISDYNATISKDVKDALYLCDAGSQYLYGTTDITRTIAIGNIESQEIRQQYTSVLCGHIDLASTVFPEGTTGAQLDAIARRYLWMEGKDYPHSTGHGVGFCLAVHEGPHGINKSNIEPLCSGMIVSIEPGYYKRGEYGIRIENLYVIQKSKYYKNFLVFKPLTFVPIDVSIVLFDKMAKSQIHWLTNYNNLIKKYIFKNLDKEMREILSIRYKIL